MITGYNTEPVTQVFLVQNVTPLELEQHLMYL